MDQQTLIYRLNQAFPEGLTIQELVQTSSNSPSQIQDLILEAKNLGFPLVTEDDQVALAHPLYSQTGIEAHFSPDFSLPIHIVKVTDSTNTLARQAANHVQEATAFMAYSQRAGVGRLNRPWQSPMGKSLSLSLLLPDFPKDLPVYLLSQITAASLCQSLDPYLDDLGIKWPNDLIANQRKIAGILPIFDQDETGRSYVILGIGLNLFQDLEDFPKDLQDKAGSLKMAVGFEIDIDQLLAKLIEDLVRAIQAFKDRQDGQAFLAICREKSLLIGKEVLSYEGDKPARQVKVLDIASNGGLKVKDLKSGQEEVLLSSEISIRTQYGHYI